MIGPIYLMPEKQVPQHNEVSASDQFSDVKGLVGLSSII